MHVFPCHHFHFLSGQFLGFDSWRLWFVLVSVPVQSVHVQKCVVMMEEGVLLGFLHASRRNASRICAYRGGGEASVDVPECCS